MRLAEGTWEPNVKTVDTFVSRFPSNSGGFVYSDGGNQRHVLPRFAPAPRLTPIKQIVGLSYRTVLIQIFLPTRNIKELTFSTIC